MRKTMIMVVIVLAMLSSVAFAQEQPTAVQKMDGTWVFSSPMAVQSAQKLSLLEGRVDVTEQKLKQFNLNFVVHDAGASYMHFFEADEGIWFSNFNLSFRHLRPVGPGCTCNLVDGECKVEKNSSPHRVGFEAGMTIGSAGNNFQLSPSISFLWYSFKHFGVSVGYQYSRIFDAAGENDTQAHLGKFALLFPVVDFGRAGGGLEIEVFGLAGYGEYADSETSIQIDPETDQRFTNRTYFFKNGFTGSLGVNVKVAF